MKSVLIVANGQKNSKAFLTKLIKETDFVIGVDGGAGVLLQYGLKIDAAVGDFDSIDEILFKKLRESKVPIHKFPADKDSSDTELAVRIALKSGFDKFILTGMLGKRVDHTLFNISVLLLLTKMNKEAAIKEEKEEIYIVKNSITICTDINDTISVYPITMRAKVAETKGLKYGIKNKSLKKASTLTLSNVAISDKVTISVNSGTVLIIREKQ